MVDRGFNSPNRKCSIRDFDLARLRVCPGKPGAGNPHAGFYLGGEAQGQPRLLPTDRTIDHGLLEAMLREKITDERFLRYMKRMFKAGVLTADELTVSEEGVPQGSCCSPVLANIFAHHVLDTWFEAVVKPHCRGQVALYRYADGTPVQA